MQDEKKFMEMLHDIVEMARVNGNSITTNEVDDFFEELSLDKKQKDAVYDYLSKGHINVIGYTAMSENDNNVSADGDATKGSKIVPDKPVGESPRTKHYRKTVKDMAGTDSDLKKVYERAVAGGNDEETGEAVINAYLPTVVNFATRYAGKGVACDELIQEGNLSLILAVKSIFSGLDCSVLKSFSSFDTYIRDSIRSAITDHIDAEIGRESGLQVALGKAQLVKDAASYLAKELGRVASVKELSEYTHIPDDEINDIIRFSGNVLPFGDGKDGYTSIK